MNEINSTKEEVEKKGEEEKDERREPTVRIAKPDQPAERCPSEPRRHLREKERGWEVNGKWIEGKSVHAQ